MYDLNVRILFITKQNESYGTQTYDRKSSGLFNSTRFIVEALQYKGIDAKIVIVDDNNSIDREVSCFRPDVVVIEALWIVPEKFDILKKLHPKVKWFCHLHSNVPFLSLEGIAIEWIKGYVLRGVKIIANSIPAYESLQTILCPEDLIYLPNVYLSEPRHARLDRCKDTIDIACFGAVRPLKNQLIQAMAALSFAKKKKKKLRFHINASRVEMGGSPVLKNMVNLFNGEKDAELILHEWFEPNDLLEFLQNNIDIGMQVSLSETFNVVTADYVTAGVPVVVSKEINWASCFNKADDDSIKDIVKKLNSVNECRCLVRHNQRLLLRASRKAQAAWLKFALHFCNNRI